MLRTRWLLPEAVVEELAKNRDFAAALRTNVGLRESYTLRSHTLSVMDCYEKHFAQIPDTDARSRGLFRIFLALHDIGKPRAIEAGDKRFQHRFTVQMMRQTRGSYPVTDREFEDWIALVNGDPIGGFLKGEVTPDAATDEIRRMAARSSLPAERFLRQLLVYYQCDVSAYTSRTGRTGILDDLFEWRVPGVEIKLDPASGLLKFSDKVQAQMDQLALKSIWKKN